MNILARVGFVALVALAFFIITSVDPTNLVTDGSTAASSIFATPAVPETAAATTSPSSSQTAPVSKPSSNPTTSTSPKPSTMPATAPNLPAYVPPASSLPSSSGAGSYSPPPTAQPTKQKHVVAWLHAQDWEKGVASVKNNASLISQVSPAWYQANADGSVSARTGARVDDAALLATVHSNNIALVPLVMSVPNAGAKTDKIVALFKDESLRHKHIAALVALAVEKNYAGLDIDYESIPVKNLPDFATFIEELATELHAQGKTLAVSIDTQPAASVLAPWQRIGKAADYVRLMAYGIPSKVPTPVVDLTWVEARLTHALKAVPKEKLSLGIPLYCNKWQASGRTSNTWEKLGKERSASVTCGDSELVAKETAAAEELGVSSFALWRLGGEDPQIWNLF